MPTVFFLKRTLGVLTSISFVRSVSVSGTQSAPMQVEKVPQRPLTSTLDFFFCMLARCSPQETRTQNICVCELSAPLERPTFELEPMISAVADEHLWRDVRCENLSEVAEWLRTNGLAAIRRWMITNSEPAAALLAAFTFSHRTQGNRSWL